MKATSDHIRSEAIAALLAGQGVTEVARKYKLSKATVSRLKNTLAPETLQQIETEKQNTIAALIEGHLQESLKAAKKLAQKVSDNDAWFFKQNAADIGVLYGILTDKSIRILEAAENGERETEPGADYVH